MGSRRGGPEAPRLTPTSPPQYGDGPRQHVRVRLPAGRGRGAAPAPPAPVVVQVHGGFWRRRWTAANALPGTAAALAAAGFAVVDVEYRSSACVGGGFPGSADDVFAALQLLRAFPPALAVDARKVVLLGHSAGGQLALAAANRAYQDHGRDPAGGVLVPHTVAALAPVTDMREGALRRLSDGGDACQAFFGGREPAEAPQEYDCMSPVRLLPIGNDDRRPRLLVAAGARDEDVPIDMVVSVHT